jgi:sorbitol-specific phosphotransferase system component IIBC
VELTYVLAVFVPIALLTVLVQSSWGCGPLQNLHEYIDLKALVSHVPEDNISLILSQSQLTGQNTQSSKSKDQLTFSEWQSAFHIYMAVFIDKFSDQAPHMLKYMREILSSGTCETRAFKSMYSCDQILFFIF